MKVSIIHAERNVFEDKNGKEVSYAKFSCLVPSSDTENSVGYDFVTYITKYENYDILAEFVKASKPVELECDFVKMSNGYYKAKPISLDEVNL